MEERKNRGILKITLLLLALGVAMAWGMVVGGGLVYAWTHFFEGGGDVARAEVITLDLGNETLQRRLDSTGAAVVEVVPDSPAERAGLEVGDHIVAVDGSRVGPGRDLAEALADYDPGERVRLTIRRAGESSFEVQVRLAEHPDVRGRAYLGVQYALMPDVMPEIWSAPFDGSGQRFRFDAPDGEFEFFAVPGWQESH